MLCAELERLEAELDDIFTALENPSITEAERITLEEQCHRVSQDIKRHQASGHAGDPCYEE